MKKGLLLGAAALAAVSFAPVQADAGEVKFGGYFRVQGEAGDNNLTDNSQMTTGNGGGARSQSHNLYRNRLQIKMDMIASENTKTVMVIRHVDGDSIEGASAGSVGSNSTNAMDNGGSIDIKQLWFETKSAAKTGVGIKFGDMPLKLNDGLLYDDDGGSVGALVLSKTFGNVTAVLGNVHFQETTTTSNDDDSDLYALAVLGKAGSLSYNGTLIYLDQQEKAVGSPTITSTATGDTAGTITTDTQNWWLAGTVGTKVGGMDLKVTGIYEAGYDNYENSSTKTAVTEQYAGSGFFLGAKLAGKTGFGSWKTFAYYSTEDFNGLANKPNWNYLHNSNATVDLMNIAVRGNTTSTINSHEQDNVHGIGAELKIKAGKFTVTPGIEYMGLTEDSITVNNTQYIADVDGAIGGYVGVSTEIDKGTTLSLTGAMVDPDANETAANLNGTTGRDLDAIHTVIAEIKMKF